MTEKAIFKTKSSSGLTSGPAVVKFIVVALLLIVVTLVGLLVWTLSWRDLCLEESTRPPMCESRECVTIASVMLDRMNPTIDPCEDFYGYACGNYLQTNSVPEEYYVKNLLQDIHEGTFIEMRNYLEEKILDDDEPQIVEIKRLYQSCVDEMPNQTLDATQALLALISDTTGSDWPLINPTNDDNELPAKNREEQIGALFLHQVQPFFQMIIAPDRNKTTFALHILPGSTVLEQLNFNVSKHDDDESIDQYMNFQNEALKIFYAITDNDILSVKTKLLQELTDMMRFEIDLYNLTKDLTFDHCIKNETNEVFVNELCDEKNINPNLFINVTLEEMSEQFPIIDWKRMFEVMMKGTDVELKYVLIHSRDYFRSLMRVLESHSEKTIRSYLGWSIAVKYMPYLGPLFKHLMSEFHHKNPIIDPEMADPQNSFKYYHAKWKQCVSIVCEGLKIPSISLYIKKNSNKLSELKQSVHSLIEEMKSTFIEMIDQQSWIDSFIMKSAFKRRISSIKSNIGVPDYCHNQTRIEEMYNDLKIEPNVELVSNVFRINKHESQLELRKIHQPNNKDHEWLFQPLDVNAFYDFNSNEIIIPLGIMRPPLLHENIPKYLQMSFFGMVIGHEIAHSIEINSKKYVQGDAASTEFANDTFNDLYREKAHCFTEEYSTFKLDEADDFINGNQTLEENLCDFASFQQAYSIYKKIPPQDNHRLPGLSEKLSADQIFMLHFGQLWCEIATKEGHQKSLLDPHSPGRFRANGVIMNSKAFAEAFQCASKSPMNPPTKCDLWSMDF